MPHRRWATPLAAASATDVAPSSVAEAAAAQLPAEPSALIVGGGPAGLAAALQLASRGWRNVLVVERRDSILYSDTDRSYVYNIDARGRRFLARHGLEAALEAAAVSTAVVSLLRVYPDGRKEQRQTVIKDRARTTFWLPRPAFVGVLTDALARPDVAARVRVVTSAAVKAVRMGDGGPEVDVSVAGGPPAALRPHLLLGCDGVASPVREALAAWAASAPGRGAAGSFTPVVTPCPSAGLRFKVLPLPPNPALRDGTEVPNAAFALLQGGPAAALGRGAEPLRLGLLPFRDPGMARTANLITAPGHPVWEVQDAEGMYQVLGQALPQADWRALVPEAAMARFAASRGGAFPAPTHSDGAAAAVGGGRAVLLLGDALHCFPPDLGQGVNSALLDVLALDGALTSARRPARPHTKGEQQQQEQQQQQQQQLEEGPESVDLAAAAAAYQATALPEAEALCRLLPLGFPYQYFNSWRRQLWTLVFLAQTAASRLLPWLVPAPTFMLVQDATLGYAETLAKVRRAQLVGRTALALLAAVLLSQVWRLAARAAGA